MPRYVVYRHYPRYGFWNFMLDLVMLGITGGFWGIWIIIRFFKNRI